MEDYNAILLHFQEQKDKQKAFDSVVRRFYQQKEQEFLAHFQAFLPSVCFTTAPTIVPSSATKTNDDKGKEQNIVCGFIKPKQLHSLSSLSTTEPERMGPNKKDKTESVSPSLRSPSTDNDNSPCTTQKKKELFSSLAKEKDKDPTPTQTTPSTFMSPSSMTSTEVANQQSTTEIATSLPPSISNNFKSNTTGKRIIFFFKKKNIFAWDDSDSDDDDDNNHPLSHPQQNPHSFSTTCDKINKLSFHDCNVELHNYMEGDKNNDDNDDATNNESEGTDDDGSNYDDDGDSDGYDGFDGNSNDSDGGYCDDGCGGDDDGGSYDDDGGYYDDEDDGQSADYQDEDSYSSDDNGTSYSFTLHTNIFKPSLLTPSFQTATSLYQLSTSKILPSIASSLIFNVENQIWDRGKYINLFKLTTKINKTKILHISDRLLL